MLSESKTQNAVKRRLTVTKIDLAKQKPGYTIAGKFLQLVDGATFSDVDKRTGEVVAKTLKMAVFQKLDSPDRFSVIADKGLQQALVDCLVKEGQPIEVVKLEKTNLSKGRTMNQYDIFALS